MLLARPSASVVRPSCSAQLASSQRRAGHPPRSNRARRFVPVVATAVQESGSFAEKKIPEELRRLQGRAIQRGNSREYKAARHQYAYTTHPEDIDPSFIIYPKNEADIKKVLDFAAKTNTKVAVRTGGHQYSGASSTKDGIVLDLSETFREFIADDDGQVTMGVSFRLSELNERLADLNMFVPHGQCAHVHVGGHAHTGGYGNSCRAFGLMGDHITAIKVVTADGRNRWIERGTTDSDDSDLFWAVLGGSPGNFAILTHIRLQALLSSKHPHARGMRIVVPYRTSVMRNLLQIKADMASDSDLPDWRCNSPLPADFDMCLTVLSADTPYWDLTSLQRMTFKAAAEERGLGWQGLTAEDQSDETEPSEQPLPFYEKFGLSLQEFHEAQDELDESLRLTGISASDWKPGFIIVWAQWANINGQPESQQAVPPAPWFEAIRSAAGKGLVSDWHGGDANGQGLSFLTGQWTWPIQREFLYPYNKRTYVTNSTKLNTSGWVDDMLERMELALDNWLGGVRLCMQVFDFGGPESRLITNTQKHDTSYSWRDDTTVELVMDLFYWSKMKAAKEFAAWWQADNDRVFKGKRSSFAPDDRRVLWASYAANDAEKSLDATWPFYFESKEKYERLQKIKKRVDPNNILTPNAFAIRAP